MKVTELIKTLTHLADKLGENVEVNCTEVRYGAELSGHGEVIGIIEIY